MLVAKVDHWVTKGYFDQLETTVITEVKEFAIELQENLETMEKYMPAERKQCEFIWKPVYDEYRRIGYRLTNYEQEKLF